MIIQISSGQGPCECHLAVKKLLKALKKEFNDMEVVSFVKCIHCAEYTSVLVKTAFDVSSLLGTIEWQCKSPLRSFHKRKNWFLDVSAVKEPSNENFTAAFKEDEIEWQFFRCSGNGGQNVNKVESGVRLIHFPSGIIVTSTKERFQALNRKIAIEKLLARLHEVKDSKEKEMDENLWIRHKRLQRGKAIRLYKGEDFKRVF